MKLVQWQIEEVVSRALAEDLGKGDVTTEALIPLHLRGKAVLLVNTAGIVAGIEVAAAVFRQVDPSVQFKILLPEGKRVKQRSIIASISGSVASILKAERTALNFLQHLSGIATETARYVEEVKELPIRIMDTRKTSPGLRVLEKYAVSIGGGTNHRLHLGDAILIKDNHLTILYSQGMTMKDIIAMARQKTQGQLKVEVEVKNTEEAVKALEAGVDLIMLDNINPLEMKQIVKLIKGRVPLEASGGVTLENVRAVAQTGVDFISVGALTHSVKALDISLELNSPRHSLNSIRLLTTTPMTKPREARRPPPLDPELDLHRFTTDEALYEIEQYLYEAYAAGLSTVRLVHGKGTGTLRRAIRHELHKYSLVKSHHPAALQEGGDGVTIVEIIDGWYDQ